MSKFVVFGFAALAHGVAIDHTPPGIPGGQVAVLDGGEKGVKEVLCINAEDDIKEVPDGLSFKGFRKKIAVQCCDAAGECHREMPTRKPFPFATASKNTESGKCFSGKNTNFEAHTYHEAKAICTAAGMRLCNKSCKDAGCNYNMHPVYSSLPCESKKPCCEAYTASCLSCAAGMSEEEYCKERPSTPGCPTSPGLKEQLDKLYAKLRSSLDIVRLLGGRPPQCERESPPGKCPIAVCLPPRPGCHHVPGELYTTPDGSCCRKQCVEKCDEPPILDGVLPPPKPEDQCGGESGMCCPDTHECLMLRGAAGEHRVCVGATGAIGRPVECPKHCNEESPESECPVAGCAPPPDGCVHVQGELSLNSAGSCCRELCVLKCKPDEPVVRAPCPADLTGPFDGKGLARWPKECQACVRAAMAEGPAAIIAKCTTAKEAQDATAPSAKP